MVFTIKGLSKRTGMSVIPSSSDVFLPGKKTRHQSIDTDVDGLMRYLSALFSSASTMFKSVGNSSFDKKNSPPPLWPHLIRTAMDGRGIKQKQVWPFAKLVVKRSTRKFRFQNGHGCPWFHAVMSLRYANSCPEDAMEIKTSELPWMAEELNRNKFGLSPNL